MTPEQLKASILQRAMEGKLVHQDPNDEPASELLKRIKVEKEKLIKEGKIKCDKNETEIFRGDDGLHYEKFVDGTTSRVELDFDIPDSWEITRLGNIGTVISGGTPKTNEPKFYNGEITWITPADMGKQQDSIYFTKSNKCITQAGLNGSSAQLIPKDSIVYSSRAPIGHINIVNEEFTTNQGCKSLFPIFMDNTFLYWLLKNRTKDIQKRANGTTFKEISGTGFRETIVVIPPLSEQKRISKKLDELVDSVNNYELNYNLLQKIDKQFPQKLRKSILQYAMQGKLVPQDPNDEPVEVLLEKIRAEKQRLFEEGKLKKKDLQESIIYKGDDNSYYEKVGNNDSVLEEISEIPTTWSYCRFKDVIYYYLGKTPPRSATEYWGKDIPWVSIADMVDNGVITKTKEKLSNATAPLFKEKISPKGTLLMSFKLTVGRVSILGINAAHNEAIISILPYFDTENKFRNYLFKVLPNIANSGDSKNAIKGTTLNSSSINNLLIPIPPINEQAQIVVVVDQLNEKIAQLSQ